MHLLSHASAQKPRRAAFWLLAAAVLLTNAVLIAQWPRWTGTALREWPVAFDLLLLLPMLYWWAHRDTGRAAWLGAAAWFGLGVLAGSWLLPDAHKSLWLVLEALRLPALGLLLGLQLLLIGTVVRTAWRQRASGPLEEHLAAGLRQRLGEHLTTRLLTLEARLWIYALLRHPVRAAFAGTQQFSVHRQGGNASNQLAFLIIVGAEIPLAHVLLHFAFSPLVAIVVSTLSLYGLLFLWAEYRATLLRPISLEPGQLHIRHGLVGDVVVPLDAIAAVAAWQGPVRRSARRLRFVGMGSANLRLQLRPGTILETPFRRSEIAEIYVGVDDAARLRTALQAALLRAPAAADAPTNTPVAEPAFR